jgi:hypothetical protein
LLFVRLTHLSRLVQMSTVIINALMWDNHASPVGLFCLSCTLIAAPFYQQAPLRAKAYEEVSQQDVVEKALDQDMSQDFERMAKEGSVLPDLDALQQKQTTPR